MNIQNVINELQSARDLSLRERGILAALIEIRNSEPKQSGQTTSAPAPTVRSAIARPVDYAEFPNSTNLREASYDPNQRELVVTFLSGLRYAYESVPEYVWNGLKNAASAGGYYSREIRGKYQSQRLDD